MKMNPWRVCTAVAPIVRLMLAVVVVTSTFLALTGGQSLAAPLAVEPKDIALSPADLPSGFSVDPSLTEHGRVENVGPIYQVGMMREINDMNLMSGPVFIIQQVVRLDESIGAGDALQMQRRYWVEQNGYRMSKSGPNDGGTFSLVKTEDSVTIYLVGFIKENMIIVTGAGGLEGVVSFGIPYELAAITSARLDRALGR
ncbi:MAG: hypothetical protein IT306_01455 [Chloroflexi bacterium]|nr:hypothetical protein [Chloroflexota bacterium]